MARFKFDGEDAQFRLGEWICRLAARVAAGGLRAATQERFEPVKTPVDDFDQGRAEIAFLNEFGVGFADNFHFDEEVLDCALRQAKRAREVAERHGQKTFVQFHFDRTLMGDETVKIVNVVIPDLSSKLDRDEKGMPRIGDDEEPITDLARVAKDSFGHVAKHTCD